MDATSALARSAFCRSSVLEQILAWLVRFLQALIANPARIFLATLIIFLFRPADLNLYHLDRVAFAILIFVVVLRALVLHQRIPFCAGVSVPMLALLAIAGWSVLQQPYNAQTWSLFCAEFVVPCVLFHLAAMVFADKGAIGKFELFAVSALAYLSFIAVAWLLGARSFIFPPYILDESLGIHSDRARGPFLQAVANGVSLTILALLVMDRYRRGRARVAVLPVLLSVPFAIFATMTRAVWITFFASMIAFAAGLANRRTWRVFWAIAGVSGAGLLIMLSSSELRSHAMDRATEAGPIEIRAAVYSASWEMIQQRPWLGWGQNRMATEVAQRMSDYDIDAYWAHNTYLEILVEHGIVGLLLYLWMIVGLFRLGNRCAPSTQTRPVYSRVWPIALGVYLINAMFVVMNYQFVNALLFTMAGIVFAQRADQREL